MAGGKMAVRQRLLTLGCTTYRMQCLSLAFAQFLELLKTFSMMGFQCKRLMVERIFGSKTGQS